MVTMYSISQAQIDTITENAIGEHNGYFYELWIKEYITKEKLILKEDEGAFEFTWAEDNAKCYAGIGKQPGTGEELIEFVANIESDGNAYLSTFGFFFKKGEPAVGINIIAEFSIVEYILGSDMSTSYEIVDSIFSDGSYYTICRTLKTIHSILGDYTYYHYYFVRNNNRTEGIVTFKNHYNKLLQILEDSSQSMELYKIFFGVETNMSNGYCDLHTLKMTSEFPEDPDIEFTSIQENDGFIIGDEVPISADVTPKQGTIEKVEFFVGQIKIGETTQAPYEIVWATDTLGTIPITIIATDSEGWDTKKTVSIYVRRPRRPYNGVLHEIPGTIEFEHFDEGGQHVSYYDTDTGNEAPTNARPGTDVDIEECSSGGYDLCFTMKGEWMEYSVNVEESGIYAMNISVACLDTNKAISVSCDGIMLIDSFPITETGDWQWWEIQSSEIALTAGKHILRYTIIKEDFVNLDKVTFSLIDNDLCPDDDNKTEPGNCGCGVPEDACSPLQKGWNIVGYVKPSAPIENALAPIWDNVEIVKDLESFYEKGQNEALNLLKELEFGKGYLVKVSSDCSIER